MMSNMSASGRNTFAIGCRMRGRGACSRNNARRGYAAKASDAVHLKAAAALQALARFGLQSATMSRL